MVSYVSANLVYPVATPPLKNGVIALKNDGTIERVLAAEEAKAQGIEHIQHYEGILVPGFVNTHCHLELSHLVGQIPQHTGLIGFIKKILALRQQPEAEIISAMQKADAQMYANGIVAVGDISNELVSKQVKQNSQIYYHTFVELFGFNKPAAPIIAKGLQLKKDFYPLKASLAPHAPYSVASSLLTAISTHTQSDDILTIHNQETVAENEFFEKGTGAFVDFLGAVNLLFDEPILNQTAIHHALPKLPKKVNTLLVHNTFSSAADIAFATKTHPKLFWCLCPNANLYIENNLPANHLLQHENISLTLGTDSLASNHQLCILSEIQTLQAKTNVSFEQALTWATLNGAKFLGIDAQFGSFEAGKKPGIIWLKTQEQVNKGLKTSIKRLF
jgi:cytosine/adenosine deaminase-related metal-dependent hydrolase